MRIYDDGCIFYPPVERNERRPFGKHNTEPRLIYAPVFLSISFWRRIAPETLWNVTAVVNELELLFVSRWMQNSVEYRIDKMGSYRSDGYFSNNEYGFCVL